MCYYRYEEMVPNGDGHLIANAWAVVAALEGRITIQKFTDLYSKNPGIKYREKDWSSLRQWREQQSTNNDGKIGEQEARSPDARGAHELEWIDRQL